MMELARNPLSGEVCVSAGVAWYSLGVQWLGLCTFIHHFAFSFAVKWHAQEYTVGEVSEGLESTFSTTLKLFFTAY